MKLTGIDLTPAPPHLSASQNFYLAHFFSFSPVHRGFFLSAHPKTGVST
jgi:hypothetical protein